MAFESTAINDLIAGVRQKPLHRDSDWFGEADATEIDPRAVERATTPVDHGGPRAVSLPRPFLDRPAAAIEYALQRSPSPTTYVRATDWAAVAKKAVLPIGMFSLIAVGLGVYFAKRDEQLAAPHRAPVAMTLKTEEEPALAPKTAAPAPATLTPLDEATPPPTANAAQPEPTANAAQPEPTANAAQPDPTANAAQPDPTANAAQPEPTANAAQPDPTANAAQPDPTANAAQPDPTANAAQPDPTANAAQPEAAVTAVQPEAAGTAAQPEAAVNAAQPEPTGSATLDVKPDVLPPSIAPGSPASRFLAPPPVEPTIPTVAPTPAPAPTAVPDRPRAKRAAASEDRAASGAAPAKRVAKTTTVHTRAERRAGKRAVSGASAASTRAKKQVAIADAGTPVKKRGKGMLAITTTPSLEVWVDGKNSHAMTPVRIILLAGKHKVSLLDRQKGTVKAFEVEIKPDQTTKVEKRYR
jgi:hypothetical protein